MKKFIPLTVEEAIEKHELKYHKRPKRTGKIKYSADFLKFWDSYPRKIGKGKAWDSWRKIRPDDSLSEKILASVVQHKETDPQWTKDGGQFIPHPATFLNQARWEDEVGIQKTGKIRKCDCGCGEEAKQYCGNVWYFNSECRVKLLGY